MLSLCVGCSCGFSASLLPATSKGVSTVLLGGELAFCLGLLWVSGRPDKQDSLDCGLAMSAQAWHPHLTLWATSLEHFMYICPIYLLEPLTFPHSVRSTSECFWSHMWSKAGFSVRKPLLFLPQKYKPEVMPSPNKLVMTPSPSPCWLYQACTAKPGSLA